MRLHLVALLFVLLPVVACSTDSPTFEPPTPVTEASAVGGPAGPVSGETLFGETLFPSAGAAGPSPIREVGACSRRALRTADISLLDALRADLVRLPFGERALRVDRFLRDVEAQGGTPLTHSTSDRVAFLHRGSASVRLSVAGTFNDWQPGASPMVPLEGTDLHIAELDVPRSQAHAYKFVEGTRWFEDKQAKHIVWDGHDHKGVGEFNALVFPSRSNPQRGRLVAWWNWRAAPESSPRDVFVYVPAAYDQAPCPALPALYFHDGNESLTRAPFTEPADRFYTERPAAAALLIFVALPSQEERLCEYTFGRSCDLVAGNPEIKPQGDAYLRLLKASLLPEVERTFRVLPGASNRGVAGASLGGLISAYAGFAMPETFGFVGSQSGSFWWDDNLLVRRAQETPRLPVRWYLDHGCPGDNCAANEAFATILREKSYQLRHIAEPGAVHDWADWQRRLPALLAAFGEHTE